MEFGTAVKTCLKKYFTFRGRARRSEYWWFYLFTVIAGVFAAIIDGTIFGLDNASDGPIGSVVSLVLFIPTLSAGWRRLHDTGRAGWWLGGGFLAILAVFILLVLFFGTGLFDDTAVIEQDLVGPIWTALSIIFLIAILVWAVVVLVFMCLDSHEGDNIYGSSPKYGSGASVFD